MKSINYLVLFAFVLTMSVSSCKKDESNTLLKEMLTAKSWKLFSMNTNGVTFLEDCAKDDIMTFAADGNYTYNIGAIKCSVDETSYEGKWTLSADGKILYTDGKPAYVVITENQLVVTLKDGTYTMEIKLIPV